MLMKTAAALADARDPALAPTVVIHPGDVVCADRGTHLQTLLGSCVAICMTDLAHSVGAMCHFVHSVPPRAGHRGDTRFADAALVRMFAELRCRGIDPLSCEAYFCGGGAMRLHGLEEPSSVGERNVQWARQFLRGQGILTHELSTGGGACYRKVSWRVGHGAPQVRVLPIEEVR